MSEQRQYVNLNSGWTFQYGDWEEAKSASFDDANWYHIGLPHSFGIPYFMENHFYVGEGSYRRTITVPEEWIGKQISLEFQGVFQEAEVFLNGVPAGSHQGGYTAFLIDLTALAHEGENQLFVRVNNRWNPRLAPRAGEHVFNGGIYRDVSLLVTEPVHVSWYGTFVRTPRVSEASAEVVIATELENHLGTAEDCVLESAIEFKGETVASLSRSFTLAAGAADTVTQEGRLEQPRLWSPEHPVLYTLRTRLYRGGVLADEVVTPFGVRWFTFTARNGFFLNGKPYRILGANVHQDHAGWSDAVTHTGIERDIRLIKDCGMNFIRGSHYPHHPHFAETCDRLGILFWSELCCWGTGGTQQEGYWDASGYPLHEEDQAPFEESCIRALREMIRVNRNHPSIIVWSMCNEMFFSRPEVLDKARRLIRRLVAVSHECDDTRPAASGGAQRGDFDLLGDLAGYNGDGASLFPDPGFPNFVSEYGSKIADRPGDYAPHYTDGVEADPAWRCGKALWCAFHHGSIADRMGHMGFIDYYRLPLRSWYWYRNELLRIPPPEELPEGVPHGLRLTADRPVLRTDGTDDAQLVVQVLDGEGRAIRTGVPVTLRVESGGALLPTGRSLTLSPEKGNLLEGMGAIELRAFYAGEIRVTAEAEGLTSASLTLTAEGGEAWSGQKLCLQPAPPSICVPERRWGSTDIAQNRPVFCSSFAAGCEPSRVSDGCEDTFWRAASAGPGEWLRQDLEGRKAIRKVAVTFRDPVPCRVLLRAQQELDEEGLELRLQPGPDAARIEAAVEGDYRYLTLVFPDRPLEVSGLAVFG